MKQAPRRPPMRLDVDLDWATISCPCGDSICSRHISDEEWYRWIDDHRDHSDGTYIEHCTPDGARMFGGKGPPDRRRALPRRSS